MKRDLTIDSIKGFLIILVVLGHIIGSNIDHNINLYIRNLIYLFHMPLFIFISGNLTNTDRIKTNTIKLLETYIVFQIIYYNTQLDLFEMIVYPNWILWYIFSLISWRLMTYVLKDVIQKHFKVTITTAIILSLLIGYTSLSYPFSLSRTIVYFPFFLTGYYLRGKNIIKYIKAIKIQTVSIFLIPILAFLTFINFDLTFITHGSHPYTNLYGIAYRGIYFAIAIILSVTTIKLIKINSLLTNIGLNSLTFYLYHGLLVKFIHYIVIKYNMPTNPLYILVYTAFVIIILTYTSKFKTLNSFIFNPLSFIVKKINTNNNCSR